MVWCGVVYGIQGRCKYVAATYLHQGWHWKRAGKWKGRNRANLNVAHYGFRDGLI